MCVKFHCNDQTLIFELVCINFQQIKLAIIYLSWCLTNFTRLKLTCQFGSDRILPALSIWWLLSSLSLWPSPALEIALRCNLLHRLVCFLAHTDKVLQLLLISCLVLLPYMHDVLNDLKDASFLLVFYKGLLTDIELLG